MREILTNIVMIALAIAFLVHFWLIVKYGGYFIQEPNPFILFTEIVGFIVIIGFGCFNLIDLFRR